MSWPPPNYRPDYGTGYQVTFTDFRKLVSDPYCQPAIAPLLKTWFGYEIVRQRSATVVRFPGGDPVDLHALHELVQSDPQKQYTLYQRAMDLWR